MLEGVDQIDWSKFHHFHNDALLIPDNIRKLLSEDRIVCSSASDFLLGGPLWEGGFSDAMPQIAPFLLELFASDRMQYKGAFLDDMTNALALGHFNQNMSIHSARIAVQTYDIFKAGLPIFLKLLTDVDYGSRSGAVLVLSCFTDAADEIVPVLVSQFSEEKALAVQIGILNALHSLLLYCRNQSTILSAADILKRCLSTDEEIEIKTASAKALMNNFFRYDFLWKDEDLRQLLAMTLKQGYWEYGKLPHREHERSDILFQVSRLGEIFLVQMLGDRQLTSPFDAHEIVQRLLEVVFSLFKAPHESKYYVYSRSEKNGITYSFRQTQTIGSMTSTAEEFINKGILPLGGVHLDHYRLIDTILAQSKNQFSDEQKHGIAAILNCEPFWQISTNLFSFFYGLPDNREKLRGLIELN